MSDLLDGLTNEDKAEVLRRIMLLKATHNVVTLDDWRVLSLIEEELESLPKAA